MIGLLLLKTFCGLSDEGECERWVHDPYFQFFAGEWFFQHVFPHERSDLSHWRNRLELLLAESLRVAHEAGACAAKTLNRVTVDVARRHGVRLRQFYPRMPGPPRRWRAATPLLPQRPRRRCRQRRPLSRGPQLPPHPGWDISAPYPDRIAAINIQSALRSAS